MTSNDEITYYPRCWTVEEIEKATKSWNPVEFRRQYFNELDPSKSKESKETRMPQKPEELIDALQDPVHRDVGRSRPARASRANYSPLPPPLTHLPIP